MIFDSPGRKTACMMNKMEIVGSTTLEKKFQYSRETFAICSRGMIVMQKITAGDQNHGPKNATRTIARASTTFVMGLSRWITLLRLIKKESRSCIECHRQHASLKHASIIS